MTPEYLKEEVEALLAFDDCSEPFLASTAVMERVRRIREIFENG
jgi:hypothetical protein